MPGAEPPHAAAADARPRHAAAADARPRIGAAARIARELRGAAAAVAFLTRIPIGRLARLDRADLAAGVVAFPLVGAGIGALTGAAAVAMADRLPATVAGALALAIAIMLTGALHLDGLADTADALGGRTRKQALTIMRDSRVGSYGVVAVALVLLVEASALAAADRVADVAAAFCLSRTLAPPLAALLPYARGGDGLGRAVAGGPRALGALAVGGAVLVALAPRHPGTLAITALAAAATCGTVAWRCFGGVSGDTLGAAIVVAEVACLVTTTAR
jgi:adenosylcobinamide-GDP ribazoletransferase